jgi:hypothetical protein
MAMVELSGRQRTLWRFASFVPAALGNRTVVYRLDGEVDRSGLVRVDAVPWDDGAVLTETRPPHLQQVEVTDAARLGGVVRRLHAEPLIRPDQPLWRCVLVHGAVQAPVLTMHTLVVDRRFHRAGCVRLRGRVFGGVRWWAGPDSRRGLRLGLCPVRAIVCAKRLDRCRVVA